GIDFEGSIPYHRLVAELFLLPAHYRRRRGLPVENAYAERLGAMARYTAAYSRDDCRVPLLGDADDARVLPFGGQDINDHRYLPGLIGLLLDDPSLVAEATGPNEELLWLFGWRQPTGPCKPAARQ